ncbi:MAG: MarR family transcriptional regulator [Clostridia bacterium]|nr:MarR family transcriptional regulator [Clostridia bacterium]
MIHQSYENKQEELLQAWINMSMRIRGNRLVSGLSFNEIIICRMLYNQHVSGGEPITASDLCRRMQLLKSQINKILTSMEKQGLVQRVRSDNDRRKMEIRLTPGADKVYLEAHERILRIMDHVCECMGEEQSQQLTVLLREAVWAIDNMPVSP